jgi:serine/threonine-protein kinase
MRRLLRAYISACHAIAYAHSRGVLHRDPKPANILLGEFGEVAVADWGLAKIMGETEGTNRVTLTEATNANLSHHGQIVGTPAYMAPEMARYEAEQVDQQTDVYTLGATLFHVLTGRPPFQGGTAFEIFKQLAQAGPPPDVLAVNPAAPPALAAISARAMAAAKQDRYPSATELARDVQCWLDGEPVSAYPSTGWRRWLRWLTG